MKVGVTQFLTRFLFFSIILRCCSSNGSGEKERTLGIIKPDGLSENAANFYAEHSSKPFFTNLIKYMTSGPVLVMILEKEDAVIHWRELIGPTDAGKAKITHPQSLRAMCGVDIEKNCVHGSDSHQSAQREIAFFFKEAPSAFKTEAVRKHDEL
ncbi:probable nucleoside diphosphate kinase 5 isoform X2 [Durio zibethinus]|uniref:Probable nucleoside diphosphate kinase 5 isoform X2 n=1 Tax=Durio zibethinus TaxID=66656 RepID=A0A6P5WHM6_DURZI|nr:probable nucleoside diphosphate kinase 5 isoform X2 [Durio zibethinus]